MRLSTVWPQIVLGNNWLIFVKHRNDRRKERRIDQKTMIVMKNKRRNSVHRLKGMVRFRSNILLPVLSSLGGYVGLSIQLVSQCQKVCGMK